MGGVKPTSNKISSTNHQPSTTKVILGEFVEYSSSSLQLLDPSGWGKSWMGWECDDMMVEEVG